MKIIKLELENFRAFKKVSLDLSQNINLFIGGNSTGKSTLLKPILSLQAIRLIDKSDIRLNSDCFSIFFEFSAKMDKNYLINNNVMNTKIYRIEHNKTFINHYNTRTRKPIDGTSVNSVSPIKQITFINTRPKNTIFPFLSNRKNVQVFSEKVNQTEYEKVEPNFTNLYSKIDHYISAYGTLRTSKFVDLCKDILGFQINTTHSPNGKKAVYLSNIDDLNVPVSDMGTGITNVLGLITDLITAENKIFIIEELENDLHPKALIKLLNFIIEKSSTNQFFITTHSNIVLTELGKNKNTKIFEITQAYDEDAIPLSNASEVGLDERQRVLEDLGYELSDYNLYSAWLVFEESSCEKIIREYVIPWLFPSLIGKVKTVSAGGTGNVAKRVNSINDTFLFLHLQEIYKNKVWVLIDAGTNEAKIIDELRDKYKSWEPEHFNQLKKHDFEEYYPEALKNEFEKSIKILNNTKKDKSIKRKKKKELLEKLEVWFKEDETRAKKWITESLSEILVLLESIKKKIICS